MIAPETEAGVDVETAPAKVNLTLHITGRRADGYHLLDSLVVLARTPEASDRIEARAAAELTLSLRGPQSAGLPLGAENLVLRAAHLIRPEGQGAAIVLDKRLPLASGIGGGSADAAATLRVLSRLWSVPLPPLDGLLRLGADLPVCLANRAARMSGIGEALAPVQSLPSLPAVLVNPGFPVATPGVFAALRLRDNPPMPRQIPRFADATEAARWLATQRNDLQEAACTLCPGIGEALSALSDDTAGCLLARMSGSGGTCFGLYPDPATARAAADRLSRRAPHWWVAATVLG